MRTAVLCLSLVACTKTGGDAGSASKPAEGAISAPRPGAVGSTRTEKMKGPDSKKLLKEMEECTSELGCDAFDALVDAGDVVGGDILAYVEDTSHGGARRLASRALAKIRYAPAGTRLVELGNAETDVLMQIDLFKAAGQCGGDATFDALAKEYDREEPGAAGEHLVALRDGLRAFHDRALPWALEAMTRGGKDALKYVDVMCDVAKPSDRDTIVSLVGTSKNYLVEDRLAAKALSLGATDDKLYDTLLSGLASENATDRDDAAMMIRSVSRQFPSDRKAKAIDLMQRALPKADPELATTLKASLAKLGG